MHTKIKVTDENIYLNTEDARILRNEKNLKNYKKNESGRHDSLV